MPRPIAQPMSNILPIIQIACDSDQHFIPDETLLSQWINNALQDHVEEEIELCLRIVELEESQALNHQFRNKAAPTNVLAFPSEPFDIDENSEAELLYLGDIALCAAIANQEADAQGKSLEQHWAHLVTHACLHLLGYDHLEDDAAEIMEALEVEYLERLNFPNPYEVRESVPHE